MRRVRFYSDDSYITCSTCGRGLFHAVIAGIAIGAERANINRLLLEAENLSGKGLRDWRCTKPDSVRQRYLDAALSIPWLTGRVFYRAFDSQSASDRWPHRVDTLRAAIAMFTPGDCHHQIAHEGLTSNPRRQLRIDLMTRGCERVTVESADFLSGPEVRFSDALAGYVRSELYRGNGQRALLTNLPDSFVNLA